VAMPNPAMRRAAPLAESSPEIASLGSKQQQQDTKLPIEARKLRQLFLFTYDTATARTIATLAYGVAR
jgi:hypothetical protein